MLRKFAIVVVTIILFGCGGGGGGTTPSTATIAGTVFNAQGVPVANAVIQTAGSTVMTNVDGEYTLSVSADTDSVVLFVTSSSYATAAKEVPIAANLTTRLNIKLATHDIETTFDAATGGTVTTPDNASVTFAPNSIRTMDGLPYTGNVTVQMSYHDPDTEEGIGGFPQPYAGVDNGQSAILRSVGVIEVILADATGNQLQLDETLPATLSFPASGVGEQAPTIPLWYYDSSARTWVREGEATLQLDDSYQGTVTHFSLWNVDIPYLVAEGTKLQGCIEDANGTPVYLRLAQVLGTGFSNAGYTDEQGSFETFVPYGVTLYVRYFNNGNSSIVEEEVEVPALTAGEVRVLPCHVSTPSSGSSVTIPSLISAPVNSVLPNTNPVDIYAGTYTGTYSGAEVGTFNVTIDDSGVVFGSGYSTTYGFVFNVWGSVFAGGTISLSATGSAGSAAFTGSIDATSGIVNGNWAYVANGMGGTFTGQKQ